MFDILGDILFNINISIGEKSDNDDSSLIPIITEDDSASLWDDVTFL